MSPRVSLLELSIASSKVSMFDLILVIIGFELALALVVKTNINKIEYLQILLSPQSKGSQRPVQGLTGGLL